MVSIMCRSGGQGGGGAGMDKGPTLPLRLICRSGLTNRSSLGFLGMVHGDEADRVVVLVVGTAILYSCVVRINLDDFVLVD